MSESLQSAGLAVVLLGGFLAVEHAISGSGEWVGPLTLILIGFAIVLLDAAMAVLVLPDVP